MTLVIVAHPDDETLFMGGQIAALRRAGERVVVVALSDGVGSRFRWYQVLARSDARRARAAAFRLACEALDVEGRVCRLFPDQRADRLPQLDLNRAIERLIREYAPATVYSHWVGDLNLDHRHVAEAVLVATRPYSTRYVQRVFAMAPEWPTRALQPWTPTTTHRLTQEDLWTKLRACYVYHGVGELRDPPHPRSYQAIGNTTTEAFVEIR